MTGTIQNAGSLIATRDLHQIKPTSLNLSRQAPLCKLVKRNAVVRVQLQSYGTVQRSDFSHSTGRHPQEVSDGCEFDWLQAVNGVNAIVCCSPLTEQIFFFIEYSKLRDLYSLPNIVRVVKLRRMMWAGHVAHVGRGEVCTGF